MPKSSSLHLPGSKDHVTPIDRTRISRRDFGRKAAVAAALALSPVSVIDPSKGRDRERDTERPSNRDDSLTPEQQEDVEAKLSNIVRKYGRRLSEEQRAHLRRILTYNEKMLVSVRSFPLQNGDSPASVLKVSFFEPAKSPAPPAAAHGKPSKLG